MKVSFTSQRRANMSNWTSLNLENPVIESPFNPYMLRDIFFDQIKSQGRSLNQHTASMGWTVWIHMTSLQAKSRWGQTALKGGKAEGWVSPKSWRVDGRWVFPLSNCTRATSDSEFFFGSSFFKFFEGYIRISKALIFPISVCFLLDPSNCDARSMYWFAPVASHNFSFITWALFDGSNGAKYNRFFFHGKSKGQPLQCQPPPRK